MKAKVGVVCLCFLLLFMVGCTDKNLEKAANVADKIAISLNVGLETTIQLEQQGLISSDEKQVVVEAIYDIALLGKEFMKHVKAEAQLKTGDRQVLLLEINRIVESVRLLNEKVMHFQNKDARAQIGLVTTAVSTSLQIIIAALQGGG